MRAAACERYGPPEVVRLEEVPTPVPRDHEVLIRTRTTTVDSGDWRVRSMEVPRGMGPIARLALGITKPRQPILGMTLAGDVEAVGRTVTRFKAGDPVLAFTGVRMGCHAEYRCVDENAAITLKPVAVSYEDAAAMMFGGTTALDFFRRGNVRGGERVLVNGASGAVGTAAVQIARHLGAEVTAVCSGANVALLRGLGAHHIVDYTREDFTRGGETYDVVVDCAGTAPFSRSRHALAPHGRLLVILGSLGAMLSAPWAGLTDSRKVIVGTAQARTEDLIELSRLVESGALKPVIDRRYPFEEIVEAHRYVETGRKRGSVVITVRAET